MAKMITILSLPKTGDNNEYVNYEAEANERCEFVSNSKIKISSTNGKSFEEMGLLEQFYFSIENQEVQSNQISFSLSSAKNLQILIDNSNCDFLGAVK